MRRNVSGIVRSLLQAGLYLVDHSDRATRDLRDNLRSGINQASDRLSDVSDQLAGHDHATLRHLLTFAAGVGVGVGVGLLMAPGSGEETRRNVADKFNQMGGQKNRSSEAFDYQTGT